MKRKRFLKGLGKQLIWIVAVVLLLATVIHFLPLDKWIAKKVSESSGYETSKEFTDLKYRYYYNNLSEEEKEGYRYLYAQLPDFPSKIIVPNLEEEELNRVFQAISYDNPEYFFLNNECQVFTIGGLGDSLVSYFVPEYTMDKEEYESRWAEVKSIADQVIESIPKGASDYEKELYLHDYLVKTGSYDDSGADTVYNMYGMLVKKQANCEGYSRTMQYLLKQIGIENYLISGDAKDSNGDTNGHMWNALCLNGNWYNLDVTWDDHAVTGATNYSGDEVSHVYFNVTSSFMSSSHSVDNKTIWEKCTATTDNYFVRNGLSFQLYDASTLQAVKRAYASALADGHTSIEFVFNNEPAYRAALSSLFDGEEAYAVLSYANSQVSSDKRVSTRKIQYATDNQKYVVRLFGVQ